MQVKILEERISSDGYKFMKGDIVTLEHEIGARWCSNGWAEDMSGAVKTGMRNVNPVSVNPKTVTNQNKVEVK